MTSRPSTATVPAVGGHRPVTTFSLSLKVPAGDSVYGSLAVIAKEEWGQIGVKVTIQPVETISAPIVPMERVARVKSRDA